MNTPLYIAKRLYFSEEGKDSRISGPAVRIAVTGVAVGFAVMLLTLAIVIGFKQQIISKVTGFGSHIQVVNFDNNSTYEMQPITASDSLLSVLNMLPNVQSAVAFCTKPGIIKTDDAFQGIVIKGRGISPLDSTDTFFATNLVEGTMPKATGEVLLSRTLAKQLQLAIGDRFFCYFIDEHARARRYTIVGLYDTRFSDYDQLFVISTLDEVRQLCGWSSDMASGIEITLEDFNQLYETADQVYFTTANKPDAEGRMLYTQTIEELNQNIFSWLQLLNMNVVVIIILMLFVSGFCIISGLIILILDSIKLIGTLKALGADNHFLRRTFLFEACFLIGKGLLWGNLIGLSIALLQYFGHIIPLDPTTYYVDFVPIALSPLAWLLLNIGTIAISLIVLIGPSAIVSHISPAKVMHFE